MPNAPENRAGYARRVRQDQPCWRRSIFGTRNIWVDNRFVSPRFFS